MPETCTRVHPVFYRATDGDADTGCQHHGRATRCFGRWANCHPYPDAPAIAARLEYLRDEIRAQCISWGEMAELESLAGHIAAGDTELLEWAGVPEFPEEN